MAIGYQHLTYEQRCQIYVLLKRGTPQTEIAKILGVVQSTVSREIQRNSGRRGYRYKQAQKKACARRQKSRSGATKFTPDLEQHIRSLLLERQWSPEQISGRMKKFYGTNSVSHERIYQYIWNDKLKGGSLYHSLRQRGKKHNKRAHKTSGRGLIPNRIGIEHRPDIVTAKQRVGDLEVDTLIGAGRCGALLSIVERKSKLTILSLLSGTTAEGVSRALITSLEPIKENVHTITSDNGREFSRHQAIAQALNVEFFFARPYHAWERGLNENTNGLIRQYFPKGKNLATLDPSEVKRVEYLLNTRPRKTLNYQTPLEVFFEATGKILNYALQG